MINSGADSGRAELVERLRVAVSELSARLDRFVVGIDGPDAAGKTTLADQLAAALPAAAPWRRCPLPALQQAMRQSGGVDRPFSWAARLLILGSSSGAPNWLQPTHSPPSKTSAAWVEALAPAAAEDPAVRLDERCGRRLRRLVERLIRTRLVCRRCCVRSSSTSAAYWS